MVKNTSPVLLMTFCLALAQNGWSQMLPTAWRTGIATNYGNWYDGMDPNNPSFGTSVGACGYGLLDKTKFPYWSVGALATSNSFYLAGPVQGCGECFEIQCIQDGSSFQGKCNAAANARSITIQITDACPECQPDQIDIQSLTFNKMAPMNNGRVQIQYRRVQCTPPSDITVNVDSNSGAGGWLRLTVQKVAGTGSISLVQVKGPNTNWLSMNNYWGASWEIANAPAPPVDMRIQSSDGTEVTAFSFLQANGQTGTLPVGVNFATNSAENAGVTAITTLPGLGASDGGSSSSSSATASSNSSSQGSGATYASATTGNSQNQVVTAFGGPPQGSTGSPPASSCADNSPSKYTCQQHQAWGQCSISWMLKTDSNNPKGYCAATCGRC